MTNHLDAQVVPGRGCPAAQGGQTSKTSNLCTDDGLSAAEPTNLGEAAGRLCQECGKPLRKILGLRVRSKWCSNRCSRREYFRDYWRRLPEDKRAEKRRLARAHDRAKRKSTPIALERERAAAEPDRVARPSPPPKPRLIRGPSNWYGG